MIRRGAQPRHQGGAHYRARDKRDVHVAQPALSGAEGSPKDTYTIKCDAAPLMKSLILELAE